MKRNFVEYFWKHVDRGEPNMCWNWKGSIQKTGYGNSWNGNSVETAHRVSFKIHYGKIPKGYDIMHICDNRRCVNPNHIKLGTRKDNMIDASNKGRVKGFKKGTTPWNKKQNVLRYPSGRLKKCKGNIIHIIDKVRL